MNRRSFLGMLSAAAALLGCSKPGRKEADPFGTVATASDSVKLPVAEEFAHVPFGRLSYDTVCELTDGSLFIGAQCDVYAEGAKLNNVIWVDDRTNEISFFEHEPVPGGGVREIARKVSLVRILPEARRVEIFF